MIELQKYLKAKVYINPGELKQLEDLILTYPWFSIAHQLVLMGYKQSNDERFTKKCKQTATYTLNRKRLHHILEKASKCTEFAQVEQFEEPVIKTNENELNDAIKDDLLLNFSHEYFSIEDAAPIEASEEEKEQDSNDLISRFISEKPRIVPKTSSISDLGNLIQIDEDFEKEAVSETLAQIYASQELYSQAISAYEKLSLLNPEKSVYFASLIDDLKNKKK